MLFLSSHYFTMYKCKHVNCTFINCLGCATVSLMHNWALQYLSLTYFKVMRSSLVHLHGEVSWPLFGSAKLTIKAGWRHYWEYCYCVCDNKLLAICEFVLLCIYARCVLCWFLHVHINYIVKETFTQTVLVRIFVFSIRLLSIFHIYIYIIVYSTNVQVGYIFWTYLKF